MKQKKISGGLRKRGILKKDKKKFTSDFNNYSCIK